MNGPSSMHQFNVSRQSWINVTVNVSNFINVSNTSAVNGFSVTSVVRQSILLKNISVTAVVTLIAGILTSLNSY